MTAREYLERLRLADREINAMLDYRQTILDQAVSIKSIPDGVCVQTSTSSKVESAAVKLADYGDKINAQVDDLVNLKRAALGLIGQMGDGRHIMLLKYRYVCGWPWSKVAAMMCYDRSMVWRMHGTALQAFEHIFLQHNATS